MKARSRNISAHHVTLTLSIIGFVGSLGFYYTVLTGLNQRTEMVSIEPQPVRCCVHHHELNQLQRERDSLRAIITTLNTLSDE